MRLRTILSHVRITENLHFLLGAYKYKPLPSPTSIRLLELLPSEDRRVVRCSLKAFELEDVPPFRALSYTWGTPLMRLKPMLSNERQIQAITLQSAKSTSHHDRNSLIYSESVSPGGTRRHSIICDGGIIKVTTNLKDALRMLASSVVSQHAPSEPSYYWIDALCMDQQNVLERNAQVAKMADIYQRAQSVVVWLGKEDEYTMDALTTIERVSAIPEEVWTSIPYTSFYEPGQMTAYHHPKLPNLSYHNWLGFIALINRPWFKRAWRVHSSTTVDPVVTTKGPPVAELGFPEYAHLMDEAISDPFPHGETVDIDCMQVVQEIAFARSASVVCGTKVFPWEKLSKTLSFIKASKWYHHLHTEKLRHVKSLRKNPGIYKRVLQSKLSVGVGPVYLDATRLKLSTNQSMPEQSHKPPLRMLIDTHRFSKSTDPRDKVYAFLGLAERNMAPFRNHPKALTPNYNLSVQEVYIETARVLMTSYRNLSLLSHVEDPSQRRIRDLPSWVPDYSVQIDPYPLKYRGPSFWKASGNLPWNPNVFTMAHGELDVQGYQLDVIDQSSILQNESNDPSASWASIVKLALSLDLPYPNPSNCSLKPGRVEVLWRTLTTDTYNKTYPAPAEVGSLFIDYILNLQIRHRLTPWSSSDEFQPHHSPLSESIYPEWRTLLQLESAESPYCIDKYRRRLTTVVESLFNGTYSPIGLAQLQHEFDQSGGKRRRLFKTRGGYLGTGARSLRAGDEVWILHGAGVPFILRSQPNGHYRLIGEAFVYGIMHGEMQALSLPRHQLTIE